MGAGEHVDAALHGAVPTPHDDEVAASRDCLAGLRGRLRGSWAPRTRAGRAHPPARAPRGVGSGHRAVPFGRAPPRLRASRVYASRRCKRGPHAHRHRNASDPNRSGSVRPLPQVPVALRRRGDVVPGRGLQLDEPVVGSGKRVQHLVELALQSDLLSASAVCCRTKTMTRVTALAAASNQVRIPALLSEKKAHPSTATLTAAAQAAALARADNDCIQCSVRLARPSPLCLLRSFTQSSSQRTCSGSPDGIRTRATALRGRRARPLHNGALASGRPRFRWYRDGAGRARWGTRTRT